MPDSYHRRRDSRDISDDEYSSRYRNDYRKRDYSDDEYRTSRRDDRRRHDNKRDRDIKNDPYESKHEKRDSYRSREKDSSHRSRHTHSRRDDYSSDEDHSYKRRDKNITNPSRHHHHHHRDSSPSSQFSEEENDNTIEKPNYNLSGLLALESNRVYVAENSNKSIPGGQPVSSVILKYHEPKDRSTKPPKSPRYVLIKFPASSSLSSSKQKSSSHGQVTIPLDKQTSYLIGTDSRIVQILLKDETDSDNQPPPEFADDQHAVIQFREKTKRNKYGELETKNLPYLIDLETKAGTFLNSEQIPQAVYVELRHKDIIQFGNCKDEYILLKDD